MKKYLLGILGIGLLALGVMAYVGYRETKFSAVVPQVPANFETSLAVPQGTSDTTMTLASAVLGNGSTLSGYYCFTVDANTAIVEYECGTASTTNPTLITNVTRGIDPVNGTTSVTSLIFSHRTGADVRITDAPFATITSNILNGNIALTNPILYSGVATSTLQTNNNYLASVGYVNSVAISGAANASLTQNGLVQQATALQLAAGTNVGSTGAVLFAPGGIFSSSSSATTLVPVTQTTGKLNANFIDQTANYNWTGYATSATTTILGILTATNSTTTLAGSSGKPLVINGLSYIFPSVNATGTLYNSGTGTLSFISATTTFPSRSMDTLYQNTTGRPLFVSFVAGVGYVNSTCSSKGSVYLLTSATIMATSSMSSLGYANAAPYCASNSGNGVNIPISGIIPINYYYVASSSPATAGYTPSVSNWVETNY